MPSFRAKARAVDLLGKGQIADLPTAICELWKNGYDAYADNLSCDLYLTGYKGLKSPIFTLSDDGTGMSRRDIEDRWIVLGTDSRVRGVEALTEEERLGKQPRTPMGEKGIGRLSVAYLGPRMLMLTKKKNENCLVLFIDWKILDNFNLFLDDVNIPIKEILSADKANEIFNSIVNEFGENLKSGKWDEHKSLADEISNDLSKIAFPDFLINEMLSSFLGVDKHGTVFIIFDPHEQLTELAQGNSINIKEDDATTNYLRSSLSGINNAFNGERLFETSFWIHDSLGRYDLIAKQNFFTREDIFNADHYLTGSFDEKGFFTGEFKVFDIIVTHTFRPIRRPGPTPYGPFKIEFGFMEGEAKSSKLPREQWDIYKKKLEKFGGLYTYRDKFRVLPYGRTDYDWLKFEERRSLSATYYQFSHRRIFGYIEISRDKNPSLKDKAGREGFIVNQAYREFQNDLIEFFTDLSKRYLRTRTTDEKEKEEPLTLREEQVEAIKLRNARILKAEKKKSKITSTGFNRDLKENSEKIDSKILEINKLLGGLETENKNATLNYTDVSDLISQIENCKNELKKMKLVKPKRIELTENQINKYYAYREKYENTSELITKCDNLILNTRKKLTREDLKEEFEKKYEESSSDIETIIKMYELRFKDATEKLDVNIRDDIKQFKDLYADKTGHIVLTGKEDKEEVEKRMELLENVHDALRDEIIEKYDSFVKHVEGLSFDIDDDLLLGWYKEQYEKINEKVEAMHELAQLGMAIEIIDHQFNVLYSEMSAAIDFFKIFTQDNPKAEYNYKQLRQAFEHLETNHQLLTPLYRTTRRSKNEIKGSEIKDYIEKFFGKRFEKHRIEFITSSAFDEYVFYTYESVIKPVFINIINNAIYWLIPSSDRKIQITLEDGRIFIMNSGEKIEPADFDKLFTLFFSRKPGGRGIGLYLAKTNLHTIGYEIYATNDTKLNRLNGACFVIESIKKE